jgi:hypothetical protein
MFLKKLVRNQNLNLMFLNAAILPKIDLNLKKFPLKAVILAR